MSQYNPPPGYQQPYTPDYGHYGQPGQYGPPAPKRPTSVTVLAIIGIILGAIGMIGGLVGVVQMFVDFGPPNPLTRAMSEGPVLSIWTPLSTIISFAMVFVLLAGSVAALSLKEWGRKAMLAYAVSVVVFGTIGVVMNTLFLLPKLQQLPQGRPEVRMAVKIMPISIYGGFVFGLILPAFILYFMTRPHVKAAFLSGPR